MKEEYEYDDTEKRPIDERYGKLLYKVHNMLHKSLTEVDETLIKWELDEKDLEPEIILAGRVREKIHEAIDCILARLYEYEHDARPD